MVSIISTSDDSLLEAHLPPQPGDAKSAAEFVELLRRLKAWSGLSYRDLERQARAHGASLPASTIATALKRDSLPHLELVATLVRAAGAGPEQVRRWIAARRVLAAPAASSAGEERVPCLLPADRARFVGRDAELTHAREALRGAGPGPETLVVTGPAGIGKTAFAIRAAHSVAARFPDGQLYVDLDGFGPQPGGEAAVLTSFLRALGVAAHGMPESLTELVHLYRSLLAQRRVLVVLDNATDGRQVRHLLPTGPRCAAIVTGRTRLAELDGVRVPLGLFTTEQARQLLGEMVGWQRVEAEPDSAAGIVRRCGRLPLAIWVAGARLAARPHRSLGAMAAALADERRKLDELQVGEVSVRASVERSYRRLDLQARQAIRVLGQAQGPDVPAGALAALTGLSPAQADSLLDDLVEVHLVEASTVGGQTRYALHDLVKAFARERGPREEGPAASR